MLNTLTLLVNLLLFFADKSVASSKTCNPVDYGAHGDGKHDDTKYIQKAIDDCIPSDIISNISSSSSYPNADNSVIYFPKDKTFLSFPLYIQKVSNLTIEIDDGATLLINNDRKEWPDNEHFLNIEDASDIVFYGKNNNGIIDGQGQYWWNDTSDFRPNTVDTKSVTNFKIHGITVKDCPNHCLEIYADYVEIKQVTILNPPSTGDVAVRSHNTDGVDVHGSPFWIHDCHFSTGDDNVALHANDTLIENCYFGQGHGASIGSLSGGWFKNITVRDIKFNGTTNGIRIKSDAGSSAGKVWDVYYTNLEMENVENPIVITQFYNSDEEKESHLIFDGIYITNVTSKHTSNSDGIAGSFQCQDSTPCKNIDLKDVHISSSDSSSTSDSTPQSSSLKFECLNAYGSADNVSPDSCLKSR